MWMSRFPSARMAGALALLLGTVVLAGCGQDRGATGPAPAPSVSRVDALHARLPAAIRASGTIRIATDPGFAPAEFFAADGRTVVGFDPDLARALGQELGVSVQIVQVPFEDVIDATVDGRTDAVMSAMTDTREREKSIDFVHYFQAGTSIVVQRGNPRAIAGLDDSCGMRVGVERETIQVNQIERVQARCTDDPITIRPADTMTDAQLALRTGQLDMILMDSPLAAYVTAATATRGDYELASSELYEPAPYGIGVAKAQPQLRDAIAGALEVLMDSGAYRAILAKWEVSDGAVPAPKINLAEQHG
jgi:polar amino acid transport system substrate-binding protein